MATDPLNEFLEQRWWLIALRGVVGILFGVFCFTSPLLAAATLVLAFGLFCLVDGALGLAAAIGQARRGERWVWLAVEAVAVLVVGVLVLAMPGLSLVILYLIIAIRTAISGVLLLIASVKLDGTHGQGWLALGGVVSVILAVALFAAPMIGAKVLIWWIGAWAIAFGIAVVALGLKLRSARGTPGPAS